MSSHETDLNAAAIKMFWALVQICFPKQHEEVDEEADEEEENDDDNATKLTALTYTFCW